MKKLVAILAICFSYVIVLSCTQDNQGKTKNKLLEEMKSLIAENNFEAARIAAIDSLDPEIRSLYLKADDQLGHASHLDVRCNERIEEILYRIVRKVPSKSISVNRNIYSELLNIYPENKLYKKKFIFYDRKLRGLKVN